VTVWGGHYGGFAFRPRREVNRKGISSHLDEMPPGNGMLRNYSFLTFLAAGPF